MEKRVSAPAHATEIRAFRQENDRVYANKMHSARKLQLFKKIPGKTKKS